MPRKRVAILISGRGSNMVALIDAVRFERLWPDIGGLGYLLRWQVERADVVLLTKPDAVPADQLETTLTTLRGIRPDVPIMPIMLTEARGEAIIDALEAITRC